MFDESLIGVEMRKLAHNINKPFQHGFTVLEWSKLKMFKIYALLKDQFGDRMRMLYTYTDSFFFQFFVDDLKKELNKNPRVAECFDFSSVPVGHPSGLRREVEPNAGVVGFFKDECGGEPIIEFIGLRPKMYSYLKVPAPSS
jgi:hypothetical protein